MSPLRNMSGDDIATLIATLTSNTTRAQAAFKHERNRAYLVSDFNERHWDRESTPFEDLKDLSIRLTTLDRPYDPTKGFRFGSDEREDAVDFLLPEKGVSRKHFSLHYVWQERKIAIKNESQFGSTVTTSMGKKFLHGAQSHILDNGDIIEACHVGMRIIYPHRAQFEQVFQQKWTDLESEWNEAIPRLGSVSLADAGQETFQPIRELTVGDTIGSGISAKVYKARDASGRIFAVKKFKDFSEVGNEIRLLQSLHHPHIVHIHDKLTVPELRREEYLVMDFAEHGALSPFLSILTFDQVITISDQLFDALDHIHARGIVHSDIKPDNVLICSFYPMSVMLADFGLSQVGLYTRQAGSYLYVAPEVLRHDNPQYTIKVDIWSLGMMLLEICTGPVPTPPSVIVNDRKVKLVPASNQSSFAWETYFGFCRTAVPRHGWENLTDIAKLMLDEQPEQRPSGEACKRLLIDLLKEDIRPWVIKDGRRKTPLSICITALLENASIPHQVRRAAIRQLVANKEYFEIPQKFANKQEPGVYVDFRVALAVLNIHAPRFVPAVQEVMQEICAI